jgi:acylphosphatase
MMENKQHQLHAYISGRVQGVGFRFFVNYVADELGLTGWVRNRFDGRVEVVAEGELNQLSELLAQLRQGPGHANVRKVDYEFREAEGKFTRFDIHGTR